MGAGVRRPPCGALVMPWINVEWVRSRRIKASISTRLHPARPFIVSVPRRFILPRGKRCDLRSSPMYETKTLKCWTVMSNAKRFYLFRFHVISKCFPFFSSPRLFPPPAIISYHTPDQRNGMNERHQNIYRKYRFDLFCHLFSTNSH